MPLDPSQEDFKYWAFISYSHSDDKWAEWLHKSLETYKVPKNLVGKPTREGIVPARAYPIFRDRDELPGSANLGENIEAALRLSRYLIVICSPRAVQSKWVDKEVRMFKSWGREDRVLCLVTDGEPNATGRQIKDMPECMPAAVRFWVDRDGNLTEIPTEPIAADARKGKDGKNNALLKLLAGILGVNYNDLKNRSQERREKQIKVISAGVFALMIVFGVLTVSLYFQKGQAINAQRIAESEREDADRQRDDAKRAREIAEAQRALAVQAQEDETKAKEAERVERVKAQAAEREAKIAKEQAEKAKEVAVVAQKIAETREQELQETLSRSDLASAAKLIEEGSESKALAYLSRALRYDADNPAVVARAISLLAQRNWPLSIYEPLKHEGAVKAAVFSPGGKQLVTISENKAHVWEAATGQLIFEPLVHKKKINVVEFSPDGQHIVTASEDGTAQIWEATTGKRVGETLRHQDPVLAVTFSADGQLIGTASQDKSARVWNAKTGEPAGVPLMHDRPVQTIAFHKDRKTVLTSAATTARIWDLASGQVQGVEMKHEGGVYCAEYSPDGKLIVTGSGDRAARLWDSVTGVAVGQPMKHDDWVFSVKFSPDGKQLLTASTDSTARLWDVSTGQLLLKPLKHDAAIKTAAFSPNARWIVTASADATARVWDAATGEQITEPIRHMQAVHDARFSPDGKSVVTASDDRTAKISTILTGKPVAQIFQHEQAVNAAVFTPDGKKFITGSSDRTARIWDTASGKPTTEPLNHETPVTLLAASPDGKHLATASRSERKGFTVDLWDIATGKPLHSQPLSHEGALTDLQFSPDGKWLLTASDDRRARLWDVDTGKLRFDALKHDSEVKAAVFSPDGKRIATASADKKARVWSSESGQLICAVEHQEGVRSVAISPDGKWLLTGSEDATARVWNAANGNPVTREPIGHDSPVNFVAFSPSSFSKEKASWLILTASEKVARIWEAESGKAVTEPIKVEESIRAASFSPDGYFLALGYGKMVRLWDISGKPVIDAFAHEAPIRSLTFSPRGKFILTASADRTARLSLFTVPGSAPEWLAQFASAVGGYSLDDFGAAEPISDSWSRIVSTRAGIAAGTDDYSTWAHWFTADRSVRTLSAFSTIPISDHIAQRLADGSPAALQDVLNLHPNNGLALAKIARIAKDNERADFLSGLAQQYEPDNPEVLWHRAQVLQQLNRFNDAWQTMEVAIKLDPKNIAVFGPDGDDFTCANREGSASKGWLPKGWVDASSQANVNVTYSKVTEVPKDGASGIEITVEGEGRPTAEVRGPHFICRRNEKCTIEGWVRSPNKSTVTIIASQFVDPGQKYKEQPVHGTPEWKQFKVQFVPVQDIAAELRLQLVAGSNVQLAGISVKKE